MEGLINSGTNRLGREGSHLEKKALAYSKVVKEFIKLCSNELTNMEVKRQLLRAVFSIGAHYIGANESLNKKDFLMKVKIAKKEAKESIYWFELLECQKGLEAVKFKLMAETVELMKMLGSVYQDSK